MIKKISVLCEMRNGQKSSFPLYVGDSAVGSHPFDFQSRWLEQNRGARIPKEIWDAFAKLKEIADNNRISFAELCVYVTDEAQSAKGVISEFKRVNPHLTTPVKPQNPKIANPSS